MDLRTAALVLPVLLAPMPASAQLLSDPFSTIDPAPNWSASASQDSGVDMAERAGRLEFTCDPGLGPDAASAYYSSRSWFLVPDFGYDSGTIIETKIKVDFRCASTSVGAVEGASEGLLINIVDKGTGDPDLSATPYVTIFLGVTRQDGVMRREFRISHQGWEGEEVHCRAFAPIGSSNFVDADGQPVATIGTQGSFYLRRVSEQGWTVSTTSYLPQAAIRGSLPPYIDGYGVAVQLGGSSQDGDGVNPGEMWFDNFNIVSGRLVRPPAGFQASDGLTPGAVVLDWTNGQNLTALAVYRTSGPGCTLEGAERVSPILAPSVTSFTDHTAQTGQAVRYLLAASFSNDQAYELPEAPDGENGDVLKLCDDGWRGIGAPTIVNAQDGLRSDGVALSWSPVAGASSYEVLRKQVSAVPVSLGTTEAASFLDETATPGAVYSYAVRALTDSGPGATSTFDPGWRNVEPPTLTIGDGSTAGVPLAWTPVVGATSYRVERGTTWEQMAPVATITTTSHLDTTAVRGTAYRYRIRVITPAGLSNASTMGPETGIGWRRLAAPASVVATDATRSDGIAVSWTAVPGATSYVVHRDFGAVDGYSTVVSATSWLDRWVPPGSAIQYTVRAVAPANTVFETDYPPSTSDVGTRGAVNSTNITGLEATDGLPAVVRLRWSPVRPAGQANYRITRSIGSSAPVTLGEVTEWEFDDSSAVPGTVYNYRVASIIGGVVGTASAANSGWSGVEPPSGLTASAGSSSASVDLSWPAVSGASAYRVYRRSGTSAYSLVKTTPLTAWSDTTAVRGVLYTYQVRSMTAAGETVGGELSNVQGWRNVPSPTNVQATDGTSVVHVGISWSASTGASGYRVYRYVPDPNNPAVPLMELVAQTTTTSTTDVLAEPGVAYDYEVVAFTPAGDSPASARNAGWRNIPPPAGMTASDGSAYDKVEVTWGPQDGAAGYAVYRQVSGSSYELLDETTSTTFDDLTAPIGVSKTYAVRSLTPAGQSALSTTNAGWACTEGPAQVTATGGDFSGGDPGRPDGVLVSWTSVPGAISYRVIRTGTYDENRLLTTTALTSHMNTTALPGKGYYFEIVPVFPAGPAPQVSGTAIDWGERRIAEATNVQATDGTRPNDVRITWTGPSAASIAPGTIATYKIERTQCDPSSEDFCWEFLSSDNASPYLDTTAEPGVTYQYRVIVSVNLNPQSGTADSAASAPDEGYRASGFLAVGPSSNGQGQAGEPSLDAGMGSAGSGAAGSASGDGPGADTEWRTSTHMARWLQELAPLDRAEAIQTLLGWVDAPDCDSLQERVAHLVENADELEGRYSAEELAFLATTEDDLPGVCRYFQGDIDGDGTVSPRDQAIFEDAWTSQRFLEADLDRNGALDVADLLIALVRFAEAQAIDLPD